MFDFIFKQRHSHGNYVGLSEENVYSFIVIVFGFIAAVGHLFAGIHAFITHSGLNLLGYLAITSTSLYFLYTLVTILGKIWFCAVEEDSTKSLVTLLNPKINGELFYEATLGYIVYGWSAIIVCALILLAKLSMFLVVPLLLIVVGFTTAVIIARNRKKKSLEE